MFLLLHTKQHVLIIERCRAFEHHQKHSIIRLMCSDQKRVLIALDWSVLSVCRAFEKTLSWPSQWFWEEARLIAQLWHWKLFCEMKNDSGKEEAKVLIYRFSEGILEVSLCCFCHGTEKYCLHTFTLRWMQLMSFIWFLEWKSVPVTSRDTLKLNSNVCRAKNCLLQLRQTSGNKCWVLFACYHDDLRHFNS